MKGQSFRNSAILACLVLTLFTAGCVSVTDEDILSAPQNARKYGEVSRLMKDFLKVDYRFVNPLSGPDLSPIQFSDLDGDGQDEMIAFYKRLDERYSVRAMIFDKKESNGGYKWVADKDIKGYGDDIYKVEYGDLNGDGTREMMVLWEGNSSYKRPLSVYSYDGNRSKEIYEDVCAQAGMDDFNGDGVSDIILAKVDKSKYIAMAEFLVLDDLGLRVDSSCKLDNDTFRYISSKTGYAKGKIKGFFLDSKKNDETSQTELLVVKAGKLTNVFIGNTGVLKTTYRNSVYLCDDVNSDGIMDMPALSTNPGIVGNKDKNIVVGVNWYDWDGNVGLNKIK